MDHQRFRDLVKQLYQTVAELESMFPGRHFTPDGHMVGSIGECLVADAYDLELEPASNKGFDAVSKSGVKVEIKATQSNRVAFRSEPQHVIAIRIENTGEFEEIYNGPGSIVWKEFEGKQVPSNGQFQISLSKLSQLYEIVPDSDRIRKKVGA